MKAHEILIKNFTDYVDGREVEATAELKDNRVFHPGDHILGYKDSIAAAANISVPRKLQDSSIAIEGTIIAVEINKPAAAPNGIMKLKIKKI
jgi:hypothetical protein